MVGVWTGCGFDTIRVILPPPTILGYDVCVGMAVTNPPQPQAEAAMAESLLNDDDIPFVII